MSAQLAVASSEEERSRNGSTRPSELSLVVGGGLVPPSPSHTPRNKSPVTVQEWVDSLPLTPTDVNRGEEEGEPRIVLTQDTDDNLTLGAEAGLMCGPLPPAVQVTSCQEPSESGSHCSSVESLLEARKPDPEEVLLSLGFGGNNSSECRIPQRFLQPSRLRGVVIDDFLRHQHEIVQNFETGFCGYRGLSGPSHTMPSVIVAKIMEKLREHERESSSVASPPRASTNTDKNKFSRVARNVLTKIRCVPGNSVLTPDNRAWLDSQGHKSPEISRKRIIIGQQSFTFSRDGDLIESQSPPSSLTDSDSRWTSSTGTPGIHKTDVTLDKPVFPSIQEDVTEPQLSPQPHPISFPPRHAFANVVTSLLAEKNQESKLSSSSVEVSDEDKQWSRSLGDSGLPSSGRSSRGLDDCESPINLGDEPDTQQSTAIDNHLDSIYEEAKPFCESVLENVNPSNDSMLPGRSYENNATLSGSGNSGVMFKIEETSEDLSLVSLPLSSECLGDSEKLVEKSDNSWELVSEKDSTVLEDLNSSTSLLPSSECTRNSDNFSEKTSSLDVFCEKEIPFLEESNPSENHSLLSEYIGDNKETCEEEYQGLDLSLTKSNPVLADSNTTIILSSSSENNGSSEESGDRRNSSEIIYKKLRPISESVIDVPDVSDSSVPESSTKTNHSSITSPWPSLESELENVSGEQQDLSSAHLIRTSNDMNEGVLNRVSGLKTAQEKSDSHAFSSAPVKVIESLDKVIESLEKIMEPLEVITESDHQLSCAVRTQAERDQLQSSYKDLRSLGEQLREVGAPVEVGSADQYLSLTVNERCALQCRVVRQALSVYQAQLAVDTSHYELKCFLSAEVLRLSDLLDMAADPDKLSTLVQQVSELLKHQAELSCQLREWTEETEHEPHALCEVVLRRLRTLELIVRRNTRELSDLRNHM